MTASVVAMMRAVAAAAAWVYHFVHGLRGYSLQIGGSTGPMAVRVEGHSRQMGVWPRHSRGRCCCWGQALGTVMC